MVDLLLYYSKYFIIAGIIGIIIVANILILWSLINLGKEILFIFKDMFQIAPQKQKRFDIEAIALVDGVLIAVLLYILATGLCHLFVGVTIMPDWLLVRNIYDIKDLVISMVVVILSILFLEHLIEWRGGKDTLYFGIAIAVVIVALTTYVVFIHFHPLLDQQSN